MKLNVVSFGNRFVKARLNSCIQLIRFLPNYSTSAVNQAVLGILEDYKITSITADKDGELARLSDVFDKKTIYYAHPYVLWERGSNENHNRLIRRWLPKGTTKTIENGRPHRKLDEQLS